MAVIAFPTPLFDTIESINHAITTHSTPIHFKAIYPEFSEEHLTDYRHACQFLHSYRGSPDTFKSYRREVERLLQWSWGIHKSSIKHLRRAEFEQFIEFCQSPPANWIGSKQVTRFIEQEGVQIVNPEWKPFVIPSSKKTNRDNITVSPKPYVLSQAALQSIFAILSSFFNYLVQEEYLSLNPVAQIRQKSKFLRKAQSKRQIRRLSELQWATVITEAEQMAKENPALHERTLFIMTILFSLYLRISELAATPRWIPLMEHFYKDHEGNWWFKTVGKGNKERDITVSDSMLAALKRYRNHLGLPPLPIPGENMPLILKTNGKGPIEGTRHIRKIVQACFDRAIIRLSTEGLTEDADLLNAATVHWLRHTGISEDVKHRPREHVRDDAGHSSSAITDRYIDIELRARHASAKKKLIKPPSLKKHDAIKK